MRAIVVPLKHREKMRWYLLTSLATASTKPRPLTPGDPLAEVPTKNDKRAEHRNKAFVCGKNTKALPERVQGKRVAFMLEDERGPVWFKGAEGGVSVHKVERRRVKLADGTIGKIPEAVELEDGWGESKVPWKWVAGGLMAATAAAAVAWQYL